MRRGRASAIAPRARTRAAHVHASSARSTRSPSSTKRSPAKADVVLLDNMDTPTVAQAVKRTAGRALLEASGGITLARVAELAKAGVDAISRRRAHPLLARGRHRARLRRLRRAALPDLARARVARRRARHRARQAASPPGRDDVDERRSQARREGGRAARRDLGRRVADGGAGEAGESVGLPARREPPLLGALAAHLSCRAPPAARARRGAGGEGRDRSRCGERGSRGIKWPNDVRRRAEEDRGRARRGGPSGEPGRGGRRRRRAQRPHARLPGRDRRARDVNRARHFEFDRVARSETRRRRAPSTVARSWPTFSRRSIATSSSSPRAASGSSTRASPAPTRCGATA